MNRKFSKFISEYNARDNIKAKIIKSFGVIFSPHATKSISLNLHDYLSIGKLDKLLAMLCFKVDHWFARLSFSNFCNAKVVGRVH